MLETAGSGEEVKAMFHRELFEIPIWELNGKFPHYWEIFGTRNSFFGILLGSC